MKGPLKEGTIGAAALAAALPAFLAPVYNPDLFWHLSYGRWIARNGILPRVETLSFSMPGTRWLDFEWLSQLLFSGVYSAAGMTGLWLLKAALMAAAWSLFDRALRQNAAPRAARAAALVGWAAAALSWSDLRPELFSLVFFSLCLWKLEAVRLGAEPPSARLALQAAGLFAVWACLHAGFPYALMLAAIYAAGELISGNTRRAVRLAAVGGAAALGALANPYGWGPYRVAYEHFNDRADLARYIAEWRPLAVQGNPLYWPFYALLALALLAAAVRLAEPRQGRAPWTSKIPWALILACGHFGANMLMHRRLGAYFGICATALVTIVAVEAGRAWRRTFLAGAAAAAAFLIWTAPRMYWRGVFNDKYVPTQAAEFMARQQPALSPLRLYNEWGWGGYLGWRLAPWYRVYCDGRYVFHPLLRQVAAASQSPSSWEAFLAAQRLDGALVENRAMSMPTQRRFADGSVKSFDRPWHLFYFPRERWALVYWDAKALLYVSRAAVPAAFLAAHEYRWLRPGDDAAFQDALARGEIPAAALAAERGRHERELAGAAQP